jgi:hypothetical protein
MDLEYHKIPQHIKDSLLRYLQFGYSPGSFLMAVLTNNLGEAIGNADKHSMEKLKLIWLFTVNAMPGVAVGNRKIVDEWMSDEDLRKETMDSSLGRECIEMLSTTTVPEVSELMIK